MDAIECLLTRNACARLQAPAPNAQQLETIFQAALRAPDHARLRPWRFLTIQDAGLEQLGELFVEYALSTRALDDQEEIQKISAKAQRAPLVIVVICHFQEHPKVPKIEQQLSAGAAAQNILLASHALGFEAIWRTGDLAFSQMAEKRLGLTEPESIIGFIYVGSPAQTLKPLAQLETQDFVTPWPPLN